MMKTKLFSAVFFYAPSLSTCLQLSLYIKYHENIATAAGAKGYCRVVIHGQEAP